MNVAFIGNDLKDKFFPGTNADRARPSRRRAFRSKSSASRKPRAPSSASRRTTSWSFPIETYFKIVGRPQRHGLSRPPRIDHDHLLQAQDEARVLLRAYRHLGPKDDDTFGMFTSDALVEPLGSADGRHRGHGGRRRLGVHGGRRRRDHEHHAGGGHASARTRSASANR